MEIAPCLVNSLDSASLCAAARVMTIRFPSSADRTVSATLPAHFFQDGLGARLDQEPRHVFPDFSRLIRHSSGTLLHVLQSIHGTNARIQDELAPFDAGPGAQRYLASPLQRGQKRAFRDDGSASLCVVQMPQNVRRLCVLQPAFNRDGPLTHGRHADSGRKYLRDSLAQPKAIQPSLGNHHRLIFTAFHLAQTRVDIPAQIAKIKVRPEVPQLGLSAQAARTHARTLPQIR
jgi:hypothetical protein